MADTFLNTARTTGIATSNVQGNIEQVNNNVTNPTVEQNQTVQPQNNQVNPITIPIQIQPQIASTNQIQAQPNQDLQVDNNQTQQSYNAPTPQQYNAPKNNNVVDFNQIYNSYNQALGKSNQNTNNSGIKKTSYNTTIVTPTVANLNSIQGQYQSAYADTVNGIISTMLSQVEQLRNGDFGYDPTQDNALRMASEYAANSTLQSLAGSGVLNSSATAERVARIVSELIPQYEEKAYNRQIQYLSQLADTAQLVMSYDNQQFNYWKDAKDREFQEKEFEFNKKQKELENAWKRVDELGYVDNNASTILGVRVGTLSGAAREAKEQREYELAKMREQAQIEHANNVALAKLRSELDLQENKVMADYNHNLDMKKLQYQNQLSKSNSEYEYQLAQKYGNTSSSRTSKLSTYDDIIKNRYAEYDDFTKQYVVPDEDTYNQLGDYLDSLYVSGAISDEEFLQLSAKYSKYSGQTSATDNGNWFNNIASQIKNTIKQINNYQ